MLRSLKRLTFLTVLVSLCGCSPDSPPAATNGQAVANDLPALAASNTPFTEDAAPDFDPKLTRVLFDFRDSCEYSGFAIFLRNLITMSISSSLVRLWSERSAQCHC